MSDTIETSEMVRRMHERDQKRAEFFATVSHDLKTPLNGIIGFSSLLLQDGAGLDSESSRQLNLIYTSARSLLERINDLLDLYRMESGKIKTNTDWFGVPELMQQAVAPFNQKASDQGLSFTIDLNEAPTRLRADSQLLARILKQLLSNALKFTRTGSISVSVKNQPVSNDRARVRFIVADTGIGIRAEELARLSASLMPITNPLDRTYQSMGLGLALAREAAQMMGGVLQFASEAHKGTTVMLVLDLAAVDVSVSAR